MAETKINIEVDVNSSMHNAFATIAKHMLTEYGVRVVSVNFDWQPTGFGVKHFHLKEVSVDSCLIPEG